MPISKAKSCGFPLPKPHSLELQSLLPPPHCCSHPPTQALPKDSSTVTDEPTHTSKPSHKPPTAKPPEDAVAPNFDEILVDVDIHEPHGDDSIGSIEEFLPTNQLN